MTTRAANWDRHGSDWECTGAPIRQNRSTFIPPGRIGNGNWFVAKKSSRLMQNRTVEHRTVPIMPRLPPGRKSDWRQWRAPGIHGARLLRALAGYESSFAADCTPRSEPAFDAGVR
jgi:hypothetical protein